MPAEDLMSPPYKPRWSDQDYGAMDPADGRIDEERLFQLELEAGEHA